MHLLHDDEAAIWSGDNIVDGDDVGVLEPSDDARLSHESLADLVRGPVCTGRVEPNAFDRDRAFENRIERFVDGANGARRKTLHDVIATSWNSGPCCPHRSHPLPTPGLSAHVGYPNDRP